MALKQKTTTRPLFVIAAILCAVLFAYVIFTPKHENVDQVVNPNAHSVDQQILGNTKVALPLRQTTPARFGNPTNVPNRTSVTTAAPGVATTAGAGASYSNLPPVVNPAHPVPVNTGPGAPISISHTVPAPASTVSKPPVTSMPTTGTATSVPLSTRPAYTVLIKAPGDRSRKAVVVNH